MNNFEKAVFVDFVIRDIDKYTPEIVGAAFLKLGYHTHYRIQAPDNSVAGYDLAPGVDDDGQTARGIVLNSVVPQILQGAGFAQNHCLFSLNLSAEDGYPYGVREHSVLGMTNPQPHVFELDFYKPDDYGFAIQTQQKERLSVVLYDNTGAPITLERMRSATMLKEADG